MNSDIDKILSIQKINVERLQLYSQLFLYGDFVPLKFHINPQNIEKELEHFEKNWVPYNIQRGDTGRLGLSLTSLDGGLSGNPDLQSLYQYSNETGHKVSENDFNKLTPVYEKATSIKELVDYFKEDLGRSRFVRFKAGGHFPPHRDHSVSYQVPDYFRLFIPLTHTGPNNLFFIYDGKVVTYEPGRVYLFNALKTHSVFSMQDQALTLAFSLKLSQSAIAKTLHALEVK